MTEKPLFPQGARADYPTAESAAATTATMTRTEESNSNNAAATTTNNNSEPQDGAIIPNSATNPIDMMELLNGPKENNSATATTSSKTAKRPLQEKKLREKHKNKMIHRFLTDIEIEDARSHPKGVYESDLAYYGVANSAQRTFYQNFYHNNIVPTKVPIEKYMKVLTKFGVTPSKTAHQLFQQANKERAEERESAVDQKKSRPISSVVVPKTQPAAFPKAPSNPAYSEIMVVTKENSGATTVFAAAAAAAAISKTSSAPTYSEIMAGATTVKKKNSNTTGTNVKKKKNSDTTTTKYNNLAATLASQIEQASANCNILHQSTYQVTKGKKKNTTTTKYNQLAATLASQIEQASASGNINYPSTYQIMTSPYSTVNRPITSLDSVKRGGVAFQTNYPLPFTVQQDPYVYAATPNTPATAAAPATTPEVDSKDNEKPPADGLLGGGKAKVGRKKRQLFLQSDECFLAFAKLFIEKELYTNVFGRPEHWEKAKAEYYDKYASQFDFPQHKMKHFKKVFNIALQDRYACLPTDESEDTEAQKLCRQITRLRNEAQELKDKQAEEKKLESQKEKKRGIADDDFEMTCELKELLESTEKDMDEKKEAEELLKVAEKELEEAKKGVAQALERKTTSDEKAEKSITDFAEKVIQSPGQWTETYNKVKTYYEENQSWYIRGKDNDPLRNWVRRQRKRRCMEDRHRNKLPWYLVRALDIINFPWDLSDDKWSKLYAMLLEYKKEKGHCRVPRSYEPQPQLAMFVKRMRVERKKFDEDPSKSCISAEQIKRLEDIDFTWENLNRSWNEQFEEFKKFVEKYGHANVPKESPYIKLASWCQNQRAFHNAFMKGKKTYMDAERKKQLEDAGFVWGTPAATGKSPSRKRQKVAHNDYSSESDASETEQGKGRQAMRIKYHMEKQAQVLLITNSGFPSENEIESEQVTQEFSRRDQWVQEQIDAALMATMPLSPQRLS